MSADEYGEWERQDELWQQRLAAGEDPGPRTPPPAPPTPEPVTEATGGEEGPAESSRWKWLRRSGEAAWCASCGCGLLSGCDTSLLAVGIVALGSARGGPRNLARPAVAGVAGFSAEPASGRQFGAEFADDSNLPLTRRRVLALLRGYKRHVSAHTPNVCTQSVSCSAYAARAVREVGTRRAIPLIIARLRVCSIAAKQRCRA